MAYGAPADPVGGTVITVAYAVSNILDPLRWLRLLTGNADPPGSSYIVASTSTTGTQWQKITADLIATGVIDATKFADGAVVAHLGYTPVSKLGDTMSAQLNVFTNQSGLAAVNIWNQQSGVNGVGISVINAGFTGFDFFVTHIGALLVVDLTGAAASFSGALSAGSAAITGALSAASAAIGGAVTAATVTTSGLTKARTLEVTIADGTTPPFTINATQGGVTVPNLKAADSALLNGHTEAALSVASAASATSATSAGTATTAATATNALALVGVAGANFARKDVASDFTTAPTINSAAIDRVAKGTYPGVGSTPPNNIFDVSISGLSPTFTVIRGANGSIHFLIGTLDAIGLVPGVGLVTSTGTKNGTNKFTVDFANNGPNVAATSYTYECRG